MVVMKRWPIRHTYEGGHFLINDLIHNFCRHNAEIHLKSIVTDHKDTVGTAGQSQGTNEPLRWVLFLTETILDTES